MKKRLIQGTAILTAAGLFCKLLGFFYRIFLSQTIGAEGMGLYQLIFPVYNLCFAFSVAGIQTALSRMIAASLAKNEETSARSIFLAGFFCSTFIALILSLFLKNFSGFVSDRLLSEPRCSSLLKMLSLSLPLSTIHACINGYFFARKETAVPAVLQVAEQLVRITSTYFIYLFFLKKSMAASPMIAVCGLVCSEFAAMALSLWFLYTYFRKTPCSNIQMSACFHHLPDILRFSFPVTLNRVLLNLLHSIESVLIPWSLRHSNMDAGDALATFGVLSGMSLPLILFPTAIINSMSAILLPAVAEEQAMDNRPAIWKLVRNTVGVSALIGFCFALLFAATGPFLGSLVFQNETAGAFIRTLAFICPFLYVNITLSSILHGLGKTFTSFLINLLDLIIRILFILFCIPRIGIQGYLYGLLAGEIISTVCSFLALTHVIPKDFGRQTKKDVL